MTLETKHQISPDTFHFDRFIKLDENTLIPQERLSIYAKEFDVPIEQLFHDVKGRKSQKIQKRV